MAQSILFSAPVEGAYELWRIAVADGAVERLTEGHHYLSGWDAVPGRAVGCIRIVAVLRSSRRALPDVHLLDVPARRCARPIELRRLTELNRETLDGDRPGRARNALDDRRRPPRPGLARPGRRPGEAGRRAEATVAARRRDPRRPAHALRLVARSGSSSAWPAPGSACGTPTRAARRATARRSTPRTSADWGHGPTRDVLSGVDALVADRIADPDRLGVTGGSYGGYLTSWIVGHDQRFKAAITCRSVNDLISQMSTGDIAGPTFGRLELGAAPWEDPELYREQSPITYAERSGRRS